MGHLKDLLLPHIGETAEDGRIVVWIKQPGQTFRRGETILEVESDKTVVEIPAMEDGKLIEIMAEADDRVSVDAAIARIEVAKAAAKPAATPKKAAKKPARKKPEPARKGKAEPRVTGERPLATPIARRLAARAGLDIAALSGTGRRGRVTRDDVIAAAGGSALPAAGAGVSEAMVQTRHGEIFVKRWTPVQRTAPATLVLIHGAFADTDAWNTTASAAMRSGIEVVAVDLPCHGRSASSVTAFDDLVTASAEAIGKSTGGAIALVGHSLGGAVAARLSRLPDLPLVSLTLIAPMGLGEEADQTFFDGMLKAKTAAALSEQMARLTKTGMLPSTAYLDELLARLKSRSKALRALVRSVSARGKQKISIIDDLAAISVPAAVIWGRDDAILPWKHALNAPPRTALHLVPEAGHMPQWERGALVGELLIRAAGA
ncbi:MAG: alpha/beta fold hydrolase [Rhodospirillales bacterium]|nr:alpha/beta fold hydrolase [Rhodospirillales bacterium]